MSKISIIVPVYNVEKYIAKCLDSLVDQTFDDYEIVAVNDGSPDNSQNIIDDYAKKFSKVKPVIKENGGYGSVLELAIKNCESEYFLICDPDDYIEKDTLEHLYNLATSDNCDIAIGSKYFIYEDSDDKDYDKAFNSDYVSIKDKQVFECNSKEFEKLFFIDPSPHSKLYKTKLAQSIKFPHKVSYTDNLLYLVCLCNADKVVYSNKPCAYYLVNRTGNTMTDLKPKYVDDHILVYKEILAQTKDCKHQYEMLYYRMFEGFKTTFRNLNRIIGDKETRIQKGNNLYGVVEELKANKKSLFKYLDVYSKDLIIEKIKNKLIFISKKFYINWVKKSI